jgi:signal transduction histidine kinase
VKHAKATQIVLSLRKDGGPLLEICDNGQGFDPSQSFPDHLGLHSMRERAERLQGRFEVESEPGQGTAIRVWLPV